MPAKPHIVQHGSRNFTRCLVVSAERGTRSLSARSRCPGVSDKSVHELDRGVLNECLRL